MRYLIAPSLIMALSITLSPAAPVLEPGKTLVPVVEWAGANSPTLSLMLDAVSTLDGSHLFVLQRLQPSSLMRAHSNLVIRRDGRFRVDGSVFLPPARPRSEIAALLAHEIAHVLAFAGLLNRDPDDLQDENL